MPESNATTKMPIYSLERLRELGKDPAKEPCCAPPPRVSGNRQVLGCACWQQCRFDREPYGRFKGQKPQRIAYYYKTIEGNEKTDKMACWCFVQTMQGAMDQGIAAEQRGERHEIVRIIGQEGGTYRKIKRISTPLKDGQTKWETKLVDEPIGPMEDDSVPDDLAEYRAQLAAEYLGVPNYQRADGSPGIPEPEPGAPGKPLAAPVRKT